MRLCVILLVAGLTTLHAKSFSQIRKVSVEVSDQTLLNVLDLLQEKSGYTFLFSSSDIQGIAGISLNVKEKSVAEVLKECLAGTDLSYELNGDLIILKKQLLRQLPQVQEKCLIQGIVRDKRGGNTARSICIVKKYGIGSDY